MNSFFRCTVVLSSTLLFHSWSLCRLCVHVTSLLHSLPILVLFFLPFYSFYLLAWNIKNYQVVRYSTYELSITMGCLDIFELFHISISVCCTMLCMLNEENMMSNFYVYLCWRGNKTNPDKYNPEANEAHKNFTWFFEKNVHWSHHDLKSTEWKRKETTNHCTMAEIAWQRVKNWSP